MITAEDFLCQIPDFSLEHCKMKQTIDYQVVQKLKEFAKLHVQAALKAAIKNVRINTKGCSDGYEYWEVEEVDEDSISTAYSLENIK